MTMLLKAYTNRRLCLTATRPLDQSYLYTLNPLVKINISVVLDPGIKSFHYVRYGKGTNNTLIPIDVTTWLFHGVKFKPVKEGVLCVKAKFQSNDIRVKCFPRSLARLCLYEYLAKSLFVSNIRRIETRHPYGIRYTNKIGFCMDKSRLEIFWNPTPSDYV